MAANDLARLLATNDIDGIHDLAKQRTARVLRYLNSRLYTDDEEEKWRVIAALGRIVGDPELVGNKRAVDLLRRLLWAMNDESGVVPYGVPEAIGEILAARPELQAEFLPLLCSMLTHEDMVQTGVIEQGVIWALGRIGPPVAATSLDAVRGLRHHAQCHADDETRRLAENALAKVAPQ